MSKERLFPAKAADDEDTRQPHDKFSDLASHVLAVPKSEVDKREKQWQRARKKPKR